MKTVLLLNPFSDTNVKVDSEEPTSTANAKISCGTPLGLAYLYTYAKNNTKDIDFYIIDAQALLFENSSKGMDYVWNLLLSRIYEIRPDIVGIGAYYYRAARLFHETCKRIKDTLSSVTIVAGGNYVTDATEIVMEDINVDYAILSEGEMQFAEFLTKYFSGNDLNDLDGFAFRDANNKIHINKKKSYIRDLSVLPIPDRSMLPMHLYGRGRDALDRKFNNFRALDMTISRGCPNACTFCTAKNFWGRRIRYRDTKTVIDEMQILKEKYGADTILINDDNFLANKRKASEIMREMIDRGLNLNWFCNGGSNVRALNDDKFLDLAIASGYCFFNLAIESSSNETLKKIKKPLKVEESVSLVDKIRNKYPDMYINAFFMVGFPFETRQDIINTLEFSRELELDWCSHYIFQPFPGTELYRYCINNKLIKEFDFNCTENHEESNINGVDWTSKWLFEKNYEYNLRINFLDNRNLVNRCHQQALKDFEYIISIVPDHAIAFRQAALAARGSGNHPKAEAYEQKEKESLSWSESEFRFWYNKLGISYAT